MKKRMRCEALLKSFIIFSLFSLGLSTSYAGCCSYHKGVVGCNKATGFKQCGDGTDSKSCLCSGETAVEQKALPMKKASPKTYVPTTKAKPRTQPKMQIPTTMTPAPSKKKLTGCCSRHKGVNLNSCDIKTRLYRCNDGSLSSCSCQ